MKSRRLALIFVMVGVCLAFAPVQARDAAAGKPRFVSLDECADQYLLGLVPRGEILALSNHAQLPDSAFRDRTKGLQRVRPSLETLLLLHPDTVIRSWGGDARLIQALQAHGIKVIQINDVSNYAQAKDELVRVGDAMGQDAIAQIEARRFDESLRAVVPFGHGRTALYYTPSGYTAGPDTMAGDMLQKLGFRLETQDKGFPYISPEVLLSLQPDVFALGFYDDAYGMRHTPGRHPLVRAYIEQRPHFAFPKQLLACSGWFTAYDLQTLSQSQAAVEAAGAK